LAFFRALQSTQFYLGFATNTNGLIAQVLAAFANYNPIALNNSFITLQLCMEQIILQRGGNNYDIPHVGKGKDETRRRQNSFALDRSTRNVGNGA
jgi:hypothetical protein